MRRTDADAHAVWNARARTAIDRINEVLDDLDTTARAPGPLPWEPDRRLGQLTRRAAARTPAPPGRIIRPEPPGERRPANMGPQPDRVDHWDAYVCRFDDGADDEERSA